MEYTDFKRLIDSLLVKNKETEWIEFKENFHSKEEIGERISALSNSAFLCNMPYGYMVFGINDDTLKVVGTDFYATRKKSAMKNWSRGCQLALILASTLKFSMISTMRIKGMSAYSRFLLLQISLCLFFMRNMSELALQRES